MKSGVYRLEWPDGSFYIGQSQDVEKRYAKHLIDMRAGRHHNKYVQEKFNTVGRPILYVIWRVPIDELDAKEQFLLNLGYMSPRCVNILEYAESTRGHRLSDEAKRKIGAVHKGIKMTASEIQKRTKTHIKNLRNGNNKKARIIIHLEYGIYYYTITEVAEQIGMHATNLESRLKGRYRNDTPYRLVDDNGIVEPLKRLLIKKHKILDTATGVMYSSLMEASRKCGIPETTLKRDLDRAENKKTTLIYASSNR